MAHLPSIMPSQMTATELEAYAAIERHTAGLLDNLFQYRDSDGAFLGPFCALIHTPNLIEPYFQFFIELAKVPGLPPLARETAILAVGSVFNCKYELYSHSAIGKAVGLTDAQVQLLASGVKPHGESALDKGAALAYDIAIELSTNHRALSSEHWGRVVDAFGQTGALALFHYISIYAYICLLLNSMNAPVPDIGMEQNTFM